MKVESAKTKDERQKTEVAEWVAWGLLAALLGVMALRLTMSETLRESINQLVAQQGVPAEERQPFVGPAVTLGLAGVTIVLVGAAMLCRRPGKWGWITLGIIGAVVACLAGSTLAAANRFAALTGSADLTMGLLTGWGVGLLARSRRERVLVLAVLAGVLACWAARGLVEQFVDHPDVVRAFEKNSDALLRQQGIEPGSANADLFIARMKSAEVGGFVALSNVYANGLVGLCTVGMGVILGGVLCRRATTPAQTEQSSTKKRPAMAAQREVPLLPILLVVMGVLLAAGVACVALTASKGGFAATVLCLVVLGAGAAVREWVGRHKRAILIGGAVAAVGLAVFVVGYGGVRDALPTRSLLFRWHYWTASVPLVEKFPLTGVGMNNFGDYYTAVKRPSAPEDVKDPHSFFVRIASEAGWPATILVGGVIAVLVWRAYRGGGGGAAREEGEGAPRDTAWVAATCGVLCLAWWTVRFGIADAADNYFALMSMVYGVMAFAGAAGAARLCQEVTGAGLRMMGAALLVGALGMLLYDQVNMAVVTGPVAALFWVLLTAAGDEDQGRKGRAAARGVGAAVLAGGVAVGVCGALAAEGKMPWDPAPLERQYAENCFRGMSHHATATRSGDAREYDAARADYGAALGCLDAAQQRAPRSADIMGTRIRMRQSLGMPAAELIHEALGLAPFNARLHVSMALLENSGLPPWERLGILLRALWLNDRLEADEVQRLRGAELVKIADGMRRVVVEMSGQ